MLSVLKNLDTWFVAIGVISFGMIVPAVAEQKFPSKAIVTANSPTEFADTIKMGLEVRGKLINAAGIHPE